MVATIIPTIRRYIGIFFISSVVEPSVKNMKNYQRDVSVVMYILVYIDRDSN